MDYTYHGEVNIKPLLNWLALLDVNLWNKDTSRQDTFVVHKHTKSIILKKANLKSNTLKNIYTVELFYRLIPTLDFFKDENIVNALIAKLPAHSSIPQHIDTGYMLENCKRFHIPLITNALVIFTIGKSVFNMKAGHIYEINNLKHHSVVNHSDKDRIHLIIDIEDS